MTQESNQRSESLQEILLPTTLVVAIVAMLVPIFLRMPVTNDAVLYDLEARWLNEGIIPYRDYVEVNFPGVLVIHQYTRAIFGDSDEALKAVDMLIMSAILAVVFALIRMTTKRISTAVWCLFFVLLFYLSQSEWCHCQRDTWLLLPTLAATWLRVQQVSRVNDRSAQLTLILSIAEGIVWGCGIWLKPHVLIMCFTVWAFSLFLIDGWKRKVFDGIGLLLGGVLTGGIGIWTLHQINALEPFFASMMVWNPGYLAARFDNWSLVRYLGMAYRFAPWHLLHLVAIPVAIHAVFRFFSQPKATVGFARVSICGLYLVWLLQSHLLQHLFDYVHVPTMLLAIIILAAYRSDLEFSGSRLLVSAFAAVAVLASPLADLNTMSLWPQAIQGDLTATETDKIAQLPNPKWSDLEKIEEFLEQQNVRDRDVLLYNSDLVTIYWDMQLKTPTPYIYFYEIQSYLPGKKELITKSALDARPKFIVTDLVGCGVIAQKAEEIGELGELAPPPIYKRANLSHYPWSEPVIFRAGRYLVHQQRRASVAEK